MNCVVEYCKNEFYSQFDSESLSNQISKNTNLYIKEISAEMLYIVNKVMTTDPCSHFYVEVCRQVYELLEKLYEEHSDNLEIDETIFE